jgi:regulator of ribosome biosynthesis
LKAKQDAKHGEEGEILEYTKSAYSVTMPNGSIILPREKPCPKEDPKTKWEKFREERGLAPRKKRSRLVFDEIQNDWVPRWGKGSIKKLAEGDNWMMTEKPKHVAAGVNPFDYAKAEKKGKLEK